MRPIRTKKHRLPDAAYRGCRNVSFTANEAARRPVFQDETTVSTFIAILQEQCLNRDCLVGIYCFMPDHLHLILCGQSEAADAKKAMDGFKYKSGVWLRANRSSFEWQDDYHDHIIRASEDWRRHVNYICQNPVRAGLVSSADKWPFTGSIGFDLPELLFEANW